MRKKKLSLFSLSQIIICVAINYLLTKLFFQNQHVFISFEKAYQMNYSIVRDAIFINKMLIIQIHYEFLHTWYVEDKIHIANKY